jgi:epoxyqueuosine reductase
VRRIKEPTYKKYIISPLRRFDERNTGFSRAMVDPSGSKYDRMHDRSVENIKKKIRGKSVLDHGLWASARTVDYVLRKSQLAREGAPLFNHQYKAEHLGPEAAARAIKQVARWLGADLVGIAGLNRTWIYTHWGHHNARYTGAAEAGDPIEIGEEYRFVIVLIHEMKYEVVRRTPAVEPETDLAYSKMGWTACSLANYIREIGYKAIPAGNELGLSIPFAVDAGLGELGRLGLLMTREFGPRVRISKVFTNLPLEVDHPIDIGVQSFCEKCERCTHHCPSGSIKPGERTEEPWDESNNRGLLKWPVHAMKCLDWWAKNGTHCSVCIRVCPWNKPKGLFHGGVRFLAERNLLVKTMVTLDEWMGYGKQVLDAFDWDRAHSGADRL